jgi:4-amino-4-deoxy-L-arabinose transferase-like glycosyltransferase
MRSPLTASGWAAPCAGRGTSRGGSVRLVPPARRYRLLYIVGLGARATPTEFYAAAVQAGTKSWKALFFGSLDQSNFITVDKPPISLWPAEILGRLFGFNAWTLLLPQALEGVAAVGLLYLTVRRWFGPVAGCSPVRCLAVHSGRGVDVPFDNP